MCLGLGLLFSGAVRGQEVLLFPELRGVRTYDLCVTPLDWRVESKFGITTDQVEVQVEKRMFEGGGLSIPCDCHHPRDVKVEVLLHLERGEFLKVHYQIELRVLPLHVLPRHLEPVDPEVEEHLLPIWGSLREGTSTRGRFPMHFRKEIDSLLDQFLEDWRKAQL